jgi:hypothetical protein
MILLSLTPLGFPTSLMGRMPLPRPTRTPPTTPNYENTYTKV